MIQGPYHIIPIGILLIIFYILSLLAVRLQLLPLSSHRKFWNTLLAVTFFFTAIMGLTLALKINYKWNAAWFDRLLQWHVDVGTGMVFTAIFHFSWHFGYYRKLFQRVDHKAPVSTWSHDIGLTKDQTRLFFILLGATSIIIQLVLIREFLKSLHGNELIIGLMLSVWMVLTASGAWAGSSYLKKLSKKSILWLLLILTLLPLLIYLVNLLMIRFIFLPGYEPGLFESLIIVVLQLLPVTLISGMLFGYVVRSNKSNFPLSAFYMFDSLGSLAGGVLFGGILVFFFENLQVLTIQFLIAGLIILFILKLPCTKIVKTFIVGISIMAALFVLFPKGKNLIESIRYKNEQVLEYQDTPYSNLTYTLKEDQVTAYSNSTPFLSSYDLVIAEESVHYIALQHHDPRHFLIISGGLYGTIDEILKYNPERIDYCESDPNIVRLNKKYFDIPEDNALNIIYKDGRNWLQSNNDPYDVILSLPGEPYTLGLNRYYTTEYFRLAKRNLLETGILGLKLVPSGYYISEESLKLNSIIYHSLKSVFKYVLIIPGASNYFIASDQTLSIDIPELYSGFSFNNSYVNPDYLDRLQMEYESNLLLEEIDKTSTEINSDLLPRVFYVSIANWLSRSGGNLKTAGIAGILLFLVMLLFFKNITIGVYVGGFTGAGIQILLIMALQSFYGLAYFATPLMVTMFMAGIVFGVASCKRLWKGHSISKFTALLWIMALFSGGTMVLLKQPNVFAERLIGLPALFILNMIPGIITGFLYAMAVNLSGETGSSIAGKLFGADLVGAALGTFITSLLILPVFGVIYTLILFSGLNIIAGLFMLSRWKRAI